jgi:hypothetical protein
LAVTFAIALGGCGDVRRAAGWDKAPPDEFKIATRAPLTLPPDFGLRPPQPGATRPQEGTAADQARNAMTAGRTPPRSQMAIGGTGGTGEQALIARAGGDRVDSGIRDVVNREASALADADRTFADRLMFWREPAPSGTVIDAEREAQRLRENQALGRSSTAGDSPIIRRRQRGLLDGLF